MARRAGDAVAEKGCSCIPGVAETSLALDRQRCEKLEAERLLLWRHFTVLVWHRRHADAESDGPAELERHSTIFGEGEKDYGSRVQGLAGCSSGGALTMSF